MSPKKLIALAIAVVALLAPVFAAAQVVHGEIRDGRLEVRRFWRDFDGHRHFIALSIPVDDYARLVSAYGEDRAQTIACIRARILGQRIAFEGGILEINQVDDNGTISHWFQGETYPREQIRRYIRDLRQREVAACIRGHFVRYARQGDGVVRGVDFRNLVRAHGPYLRPVLDALRDLAHGDVRLLAAHIASFAQGIGYTVVPERRERRETFGLSTPVGVVYGDEEKDCDSGSLIAVTLACEAGIPAGLVRVPGHMAFAVAVPARRGDYTVSAVDGTGATVEYVVAEGAGCSDCSDQPTFGLRAYEDLTARPLDSGAGSFIPICFSGN